VDSCSKPWNRASPARISIARAIDSCLGWLGLQQLESITSLVLVRSMLLPTTTPDRRHFCARQKARISVRPDKLAKVSDIETTHRVSPVPQLHDPA
jgi:hypothetical protein